MPRKKKKPDKVHVTHRLGAEICKQIEAEALRVGVNRSKVVRDALTLAFLYREGKLKPTLLPEGIACFTRRK